MEDEDPSGIFDTPMTLYMVVAKRFDIEADYNMWELYRQIFYNEVSETEYNKRFYNPNRDYHHRIIDHRDTIYRVSEEIAFRMYRTGNKKLYLSSKELYEIIVELSKEDESLRDIEIRQLADRCYALCSYWKANTGERQNCQRVEMMPQAMRK